MCDAQPCQQINWKPAAAHLLANHCQLGELHVACLQACFLHHALLLPFAHVTGQAVCSMVQHDIK